jgi:hypothetical protein
MTSGVKSISDRDRQELRLDDCSCLKALALETALLLELLNAIVASEEMKAGMGASSGAHHPFGERTRAAEQPKGVL